ncbi:hypothetical protein IKE07_00255 [Candidatus Saccharibacteria bacterium]|nr:hypothetical protein [Candidatus Saccharibacteria bacterium]
MNEKNFDEWNELKKELQLGKSMPMITEGDIWWCDIDFQNKNQVAVLSQIRPYSVYRLSCRMGSLDDVDRERVKDSLLKFLR